MKFLNYFLYLLIFFNAAADAQSLTLRTISQLHDTIFECSGIQEIVPGRLLMHNDSGDQPRFFITDTSGNILSTRYLENVIPIDFEDITKDDKGNIYIGDFGNNFNTRTDLKIYKIAAAEIIAGGNITTEVINFSYPGQSNFPPAQQDMNFDCEAFFYYRDSLYLFSKNRGTSQYTSMYSLPANGGNYEAVTVDSFYTGRWITSAAINRSATAFVLLSESRIFLYTDFLNGNFSNVTERVFEIDSTQKEGVCFINDTAIYITDEGFPGAAGNLYYASLGKWIPHKSPVTPFAIQIFNNPSRDGFTIFMEGSDSYTLNIFDALGKFLDEKILSAADMPYHYKKYKTGLLFLRITSHEGFSKSAKVFLY